MLLQIDATFLGPVPTLYIGTEKLDPPIIPESQ